MKHHLQRWWFRVVWSLDAFQHWLSPVDAKGIRERLFSDRLCNYVDDLLLDQSRGLFDR